MASWSVGVSLRGKDGLSVLAGNGAPSPILGDVGQPGYIDVQNSRLYGPKTAQGWPTTYVNLQATLPNNLQGNSLILAPVQGETLATQITLKGANNTTLFSVDATGAMTALSAAVTGLSVSGSGSVGGALSVVNTASAQRFVANSPGSLASPMLAYTATGTSSGYTCGIYSDNIKSEIYEVVAGRVARSITFVGTTPDNSDRTYVTHSFYSTVAETAPSHRFYTAGALALLILGSGNAQFGAALSIAGLTTSAGLKLSSGALTFADGTTQTTAGGAPAAVATYAATGTGSAASPAYRYSAANNGAGLYFDGAQGNTLLSVNGFKSLYSTSAANAASGASGWAIASTLGAGSPLLALFGAASTTVPVLSVDGAGALVNTGLHKSAGLTLTSGALTFADGTAMTTAATGGGAGGASGSQIRYGTGAPSTTNPTTQNDGDSYIDQQQSMLYGPRANGVWPTTPVSLIGPTGPAGFSTLSSQSAGYGPSIAMSGTALSATAQAAFIPGTTQANSFFSVSTTALVGYTVTNPGPAFTLTLVNTTASSTLATFSIAANSTLGASFSLTQYPMAAGSTYQWQVTGSGTASFCLTPAYLFPAASPSYNVSSLPSVGVSATTTFSGTGLQLQYPGTTIGNAFRITRASYLYAVTLRNNTPNSMNFTLNYSNNGGAYVVGASFSVPASSTSTPGPFAVNTYAFANPSTIYWSVTGSGSGTCFADTQLVTIGS